MSELVTIGVPVFHGAEFLDETVESILAQTHSDWECIFSVDGPDPVCEELCGKYLVDPRFRLSVQPQRVGWLQNIGWLQQQAKGEFWCYQQQDDLLDPMYIEVLLGHARAWPGAAVVYCDIETFGNREMRFVRPSVVGSPIGRFLSILTDQFAGVAFRGLTRVTALRDTGGGIVENDVENFAAETVWIGTMATWGELIHVPETLYRKRYHDRNVHSLWMEWEIEERSVAWVAHCHDLLEVATRISAHQSERWMLWFATLIRLTSSRATPYLPWSEFTPSDRIALIDALLARAHDLQRIELPTWLSAASDEIRDRSIVFASER